MTSTIIPFLVSRSNGEKTITDLLGYHDAAKHIQDPAAQAAAIGSLGQINPRIPTDTRERCLLMAMPDPNMLKPESKSEAPEATMNRVEAFTNLWNRSILRNITALRLSGMKGSLTSHVSYWPLHCVPLSKAAAESLASCNRMYDTEDNPSVLCMTKWLGDELQRVLFPDHRDTASQWIATRHDRNESPAKALAHVTAPQKTFSIVLPDDLSMLVQLENEYNTKCPSKYDSDPIPLTGKVTLNAAISSIVPALGYLAPAGSLISAYHTHYTNKWTPDRINAFGDQSEVELILRPPGSTSRHPSSGAAAVTPPSRERGSEGGEDPEDSGSAPSTARTNAYSGLRYFTEDGDGSDIQTIINTAFWLTGSCNASRNHHFYWNEESDRRPFFSVKLYPTGDASSVMDQLQQSWREARQSYQAARGNKPDGILPGEDQLTVEIMSEDEAAKVRLSPM